MRCPGWTELSYMSSSLLFSYLTNVKSKHCRLSVVNKLWNIASGSLWRPQVIDRSTWCSDVSAAVVSVNVHLSQTVHLLHNNNNVEKICSWCSMFTDKSLPHWQESRNKYCVLQSQTLKFSHPRDDARRLLKQKLFWVPLFHETDWNWQIDYRPRLTLTIQTETVSILFLWE